jgi:hypothetical protein
VCVIRRTAELYHKEILVGVKLTEIITIG